MGPRPANLDLSRSQHNNADLTPPRFPNFHMDLPSPRSGEAPPALSPLDAFAQHSRMLAMKFDQEAQKGKRLSRLPHADVARELANRPGYFRHVSDTTEGGMSDLGEVSEEDRPNSGDRYKLKEGAKNKHKSQYPMLGTFGRDSQRDSTASHFYDIPEPSPAPSERRDYFDVGAPRASSPEMVESSTLNIGAPSPNFPPSLTSSVDSYRSMSHPRTLTNGSTRSQKSDHGLRLPLSSVFSNPPRSAQNIHPVRQDSLEDDAVSNHGSQSGRGRPTRDYPHNNAQSRPSSPFTNTPAMHRSPSTNSEYSQTGSQFGLPKPSFNFSRPLSSHGNQFAASQTRPSLEGRRSFDTRSAAEQRPHRPSAASTMTVATVQSTASTPLSRQVSQDNTPTPQAPALLHTNMPIPRYLTRTDSDMSNNGVIASSPIGNDQDEELPRGREMQRSSAESRTSWINNQFKWDTPEDERSRDHSTVKMVPRDASPTPSERLQKMAEMQIEATERLGRDAGFASMSRSRSADPRAGTRANAKHAPTPSVQTDITDSTDRTIRQTPLHQRAASAELTAEEHLEIGIQAHSSGSLTKSTYHLRLAAREGLPTAMLLYALACRHGWGMRPSQEDGVAWLRKAIESSGLEVADVEQTITNAGRKDGKADPVVEAAERRKRKAQFGLAVYELGISYMNGWGCQKDKPLALQCYEVAGGWGDCDALAEAGYCYTQGIGCKKDMKKAATLYRKAADLGMSMAGNSW
jgi:TPR repeat protein